MLLNSIFRPTKPLFLFGCNRFLCKPIIMADCCWCCCEQVYILANHHLAYCIIFIFSFCNLNIMLSEINANNEIETQNENGLHSCWKTLIDITPEKLLHDSNSLQFNYNICSEWYVNNRYSDALKVLENMCTQSIDQNECMENIGVILLSHFLRMEIILKVLRDNKYVGDDNIVGITPTEVLKIFRSSEEFIVKMQHQKFHANHRSMIPSGSDVLRLQTTNTIDPSNNNITEYGYLMYIGFIVAYRMYVLLARLYVTLKSMNDAKINLRYALDIYSRFLKVIELQQGTDINYDNFAEVSTLIPLVGKLNCDYSSKHSISSQISRHHRIVMDVLAEFYDRSRSYTDALNSLCGSVSVQPLPMYAALERLRGEDNTVTATSSDRSSSTASRLNNAACVLLHSEKPYTASLLLRQSVDIHNTSSNTTTATTSSAIEDNLTTAECVSHTSGSEHVVSSANYPGSLHIRSPSIAQYNLAVTLLRQSQPFEALLLLNSLPPERNHNPYIWIRRAESCLLHNHLLLTCLQNYTVNQCNIPSKAHIAVQPQEMLQDWRLILKFPLQSQSRSSPTESLYSLAVEHIHTYCTAAASTDPSTPTNDYFTSCMRLIQQSIQYNACLPETQTEYILHSLVDNHTHSKAVEYLSTGLGIINRALNHISKETLSQERERNLLCLKSTALLKLTYAHLVLGSLHCALISSQELRQLPATAMTEHHKNLATFYHVEILCRLGSEHEAAVLLKASSVGTLNAWNSILQHSYDSSLTNASAMSNDDRIILLNSVFSSNMFFTGNQRIRELSNISSSNMTILLKQLYRVNDAVVLLLRHELEAARIILEDIVRTERDLVIAVQNLLYVYIKQGKGSEAVSLLRLINSMPSV